MELVKIESNPDLARDLSSGAVINTNVTEYQNYLARKKINKELKDQIKNNTDKIEQIESDVSEIKQMLITLLNKER
jgi:wobble nucleotide-excising tRNase